MYIRKEDMHIICCLIVYTTIDTPVTGPSRIPTGPLNTLGDITAATRTCVRIHLAAHAKCMKLHHALGHIYTTV